MAAVSSSLASARKTLLTEGQTLQGQGSCPLSLSVQQIALSVIRQYKALLSQDGQQEKLAILRLIVESPAEQTPEALKVAHFLIERTRQELQNLGKAMSPSLPCPPELATPIQGRELPRADSFTAFQLMDKKKDPQFALASVESLRFQHATPEDLGRTLRSAAKRGKSEEVKLITECPLFNRIPIRYISEALEESTRCRCHDRIVYKGTDSDYDGRFPNQAVEPSTNNQSSSHFESFRIIAESSRFEEIPLGDLFRGPRKKGLLAWCLQFVKEDSPLFLKVQKKMQAASQ